MDITRHRGRSTGGASGHSCVGHHECISTPRTPACSRHPQRLDHGEDILVPGRRDLAVDAGAAVRAAPAGPVGGGGGDDVARLLRLRIEHLRSHVTLKLVVTGRQPASIQRGLSKSSATHELGPLSRGEGGVGAVVVRHIVAIGLDGAHVPAHLSL